MRYRDLLERVNPLSPDFKAWFGNSKVVDGKGNPLIVYHGTNKQFSTFKLPGSRGTGGNAIFFATSPETANYFTHGAPNSQIKPAYVRMEHPFDYRNPQHIAGLSTFIERNFAAIFPGALYGPSLPINEITHGGFGSLERPLIRRWMRRHGFDGFWANEGPGQPMTLGVFDPAQIRSAISL